MELTVKHQSIIVTLLTKEIIELSIKAEKSSHEQEREYFENKMKELNDVYHQMMGIDDTTYKDYFDSKSNFNIIRGGF